jgi:hypothetical protein
MIPRVHCCASGPEATSLGDTDFSTESVKPGYLASMQCLSVMDLKTIPLP